MIRPLIPAKRMVRKSYPSIAEQMKAKAAKAAAFRKPVFMSRPVSPAIPAKPIAPIAKPIAVSKILIGKIGQPKPVYQQKKPMPLPLIATGVAAVLRNPGKAIATVGKVGKFIGGLFKKRKKTSGPLGAATSQVRTALPVASSKQLVYSEDPAGSMGSRKPSSGFGQWIKDNTVLAIGIGVAVIFLLFGKKKIF